MEENFNFSYSFTTDDHRESNHVSKALNVQDAATLPEVLEAFRDFLVRAGYDYVTELTAEYGSGSGCSSSDWA